MLSLNRPHRHDKEKSQHKEMFLTIFFAHSQTLTLHKARQHHRERYIPSVTGVRPLSCIIHLPVTHNQ